MVHQKIYEHLIQVAKSGDIVPYSHIAPMASLNMDNAVDRQQLSEILSDISEFQHQQGRPLLSAVVTFKDIPYPGKGFFDLARRCGKYDGHKETDELDFFVQELKRVHAHWQNG
jgi:hypothetical protein